MAQKINLFDNISNLAHSFFLIFCMKLGVHKGSNVTEPIFSEKKSRLAQIRQKGAKMAFSLSKRN